MPNLYLFLLLLIWLGGFPLSDDVMLDPGWWQENINIYAHLSIVTLFLESIFSKECGNRYRMKQEKRFPCQKKKTTFDTFCFEIFLFLTVPVLSIFNFNFLYYPFFPFRNMCHLKKNCFNLSVWSLTVALMTASV